jgi:hypothetical protein
MAVFVLKNVEVSIGTTDLSTYCRSATLNLTVDTPDATCFGVTGALTTFKSRCTGGLKDWSLDCELFNDVAQVVEGKLNSGFGANSAFIGACETAAQSSTNPEWSGNMILESWAVFDGAVGDPAIYKCHFVGNGTLARAVA